jgi:putative ABC transport system ATP-binding protein
MTEMIAAEGLTKTYRLGAAEVHALRGVDLAVQPGEFVALMGPSGCGKTTLLQLLGCLDAPTSGRYRLEGRDVSRLSKADRARLRNTRLGFVFQNFFLLPNQTSLENVALPLLYQRSPQPVAQRAAAALEQVGLADRAGHRPMELSGGECQRVAIARALVNQPALLLADEPTGNLDSTTGDEIMALLLSLWQAGLTILLVTHDAQIAGRAQRILHMKDGQILREEANHVAR